MSPIDQNSLAIETIQSPLSSAIQYARRFVISLFVTEKKKDPCLAPTLSAESSAERAGDAKRVSEYLKDNFLINISANSVSKILEATSQNGGSLVSSTNHYLLSNKSLLAEACKRAIAENNCVPDNRRIGLLAKQAETLIEGDLSKTYDLRAILKDVFGAIVDKPDSQQMRRTIGDARNKAIKAVKKDPALTKLSKNWNANPLALNDDQLSRLFTPESPSISHLSTDFDTAQFGHKSQIVGDALGKFIDAKKEKEGEAYNYGLFVSSIKRWILDALEPVKELNAVRRFSSENLFFTSNGSNAFKLFANSFIQEGERLLTTSDEYMEMLGGVTTDRKANLDNMKGASDDAQFLSDLRERFSDEATKPTYFLVSYPSRRGPLFPMQEIQKLCDEFKVHLVIDGCQAIGRRTIDLGALKPSVFFGSCQKGSNAKGAFRGILALSDSFLAEERTMPHSTNPECGTMEPLDMLPLAYACAPDVVSKTMRNFGVDLPKPLTVSIKDRQAAIEALSKQFAEAVRFLQGQSRKSALQVLRPTSVADSAAPLSGIFECVVSDIDSNLDAEGKPDAKTCLDASIVANAASSLGINISPNYHDPLVRERLEGPADKDGKLPYIAKSFRIAMHPFMDKQSILMLTYLFQQIQKL